MFLGTIGLSGWLLSMLFLLVQGEMVSAFQNPPILGSQAAALRSEVVSTRSSSSQLFLFGDFKKLFDGPLWGGGDGGDSEKSNEENNNGLLDDEDLPAGTVRVATLPVKSIKPGGLRLFLMFYLMGMQNTPDRRSWSAHQPTTNDNCENEYVIDFAYHDRTAGLTIEMTEEAITIDRVGSSPSTAYLMQETTILQGVLEELRQCAFDEDIEEANRLLLLRKSSAIEDAKDQLSFG